MKMRIVAGAAVCSLGLGCTEHPEEGTVVKLAPGIAGLPGGVEGISSDARPVSGGTLLIARDGVTAVASDPDRDRVWVVRLDDQRVRSVELELGDEPGRVVEGPDGTVYVALRSGGAVVSVDLATVRVTSRTAVCAAPRGIAYDAVRGLLHTACAGGDLVSFSPAKSEQLRRVRLAADLRDVVVSGRRLLVSRFRLAEVLVVEDGAAVGEPVSLSPLTAGATASVAWRMQALPSGETAVLHQRGRTSALGSAPGAYYGAPATPCTAIVETAVSTVSAAGTRASSSAPPAIASLVGVSDVAFSRSSGMVAFVSLGGAWSEEGPSVVTMRASDAERPVGCADGQHFPVQGEPVAIAYDGSDRVVVQSREPAQLQVVDGPVIALGGDARPSTGLAIFHMDGGVGIACASCHPEGGEDGRVWALNGAPPRRTQTTAAPVATTAPYHWGGEIETMRTLVHSVLAGRMGSDPPNSPQLEHLVDWMEAVEPPAPRGVDAALAARGEVLFHGEQAACAGCHSGEELTNNESYVVRSTVQDAAARYETSDFERPMQVPSLIGVAARAPFFHDGCAETLDATLVGCGTERGHGGGAQLTDADRKALVAYLETL